MPSWQSGANCTLRTLSPQSIVATAASGSFTEPSAPGVIAQTLTA